MTEITQLIDTIKRQLKIKGLTYRDVGKSLNISEPSVKRLFSSKRLTVERMGQLCELLEFTFAELVEVAAASRVQIHTLSQKQEALLISDEALLLVSVCALNHWTLPEIVTTYRISNTECLKHLLILDRMKMIELLPNDRIRLSVARDFDWLPDGPIARFFLKQGIGDFIASKFDHADETMEFSHGMLTKKALAQLQLELRRMKGRLAALHNESNSATLSQRRGVGMLLAMREWEPVGFKQLRIESVGAG